MKQNSKEHSMKITNNPTFNTYALNDSASKTDAILSKIAATRELSGKDSADLLISDALSSQISSLTQSVQNANELVGMYQIADASLQAVQAGSEKLNELSVRFNSATLNADQKASLQKESSMEREKILETLKKLKSLYRPEGVEIIGLFGSHAHGNADAYSDIDVAYALHHDQFSQKYHDGFSKILKIQAIKEELENALHTKVDFISLDSSNHAFTEQIKKEMIYV